MKENYIGRLNKLIEEVPLKCNFISEEEWNLKPRPEKWSKKEILGHLVDSGYHNLKRFNEMLYEDEPYILVTYQQDDLVRTNNYQEQDLDQIVSLWKFLNKQIISVWKNTPEKRLDMQLLTYTNQEVTLGWWMDDYIKHAVHHLNQIFDKQIPLSSLTNSKVSVAEALKILEEQNSRRDAVVFSYGTMEVEIYAPIKIDHQEPHTRDELYIIIEGTGNYILEGSSQRFGPGDVLFAPAGSRHKFEDFSDDFKTWVVFYGPIGGE